MAAPFDYRDVSRRADAIGKKLRKAEDYRDDFWEDASLGPILKVYAILTHFPEEAFDSEVSEKQIADGRLYTFARLARLHRKRDGCDCIEIDGMDDLLSELDEVADQDSMKAIQAGEKDASRQYSDLKKKGQADPVEH